MHSSHFKKRNKISDRDRRREALEITRSLDRAQLLADLRQLAETELSGASDGRRSRFRQEGRVTLTEKLMYPDWFLSIPENFRVEWMVQMRPAGRRVIATIREGILRVHSAKNGKFMAEFPINQGLLCLGRLTVLDGVLDESGNFFVLDVLFWDGAEIADCDAECRHFWLYSRFSEVSEISEITGNFRISTIRYIGPVDATAENISAVYAGDGKFIIPEFPQSRNFHTDSLLFMHKSAVYSSGLSALYLQWRDGKICKFPIDTADDTGESIPVAQAVVLKAKRRGTSVVFKTWDSMKLAKLNEQESESVASLFKVDEASCLVRGLIDGVDEEDTIRLRNFRAIERLSSVRKYPDSLGRILTQAKFREFGQPYVSIEQLCSR